MEEFEIQCVKVNANHNKYNKESQEKKSSTPKSEGRERIKRRTIYVSLAIATRSQATASPQALQALWEAASPVRPVKDDENEPE